MRLTAPLLAAVLAAAIAGCGGSGGESTTQAPPPATTPQSLGYTQGRHGAERAVTAAVATYDAAIRSGDGKTVCRLTSRTERALKICRQTLAGTLQPEGRQPDYRVASVSVSGRNAKVTLRAKGEKPVFYTLVRDGGEWKVLVVTNQGG